MGVTDMLQTSEQRTHAVTAAARAASAGAQEYLTFRLGDEEYGVDILKVQEIRGYDADTGEILWTADLPAGSEGIPAMYEAGGTQYLVVPASSRRRPVRV